MAVVFPYVKQTWTDGVSSCSAARNNVHEDGIFNAHNAPAVRVFHNANQSITTATNTALAFNSERFDQAGGASANHHDTATNNNRLTCLYAGIYLISGEVRWASNATGHRLLRIRNQTGTVLVDTSTAAISGQTTEQSASCLWLMAVNDWVELVVLQTSGVALDVVSASAVSPEFMMVRVA